MPNRIKIALLFLLAFAFRFYFGLSSPPYMDTDDEIQTYLIGLKCHTTHTWPFFGPDVVGSDSPFQTQIPGALEGLLISLPLRVWPAPESPFLFLNLLTLGAFSLLAWYASRRLPRLPRFFIYTWIFLAPWNLHYSTAVINPSYAVVGAVLFFLGFFESLPELTVRLFSPWLANALMGFSFLWIMQLHMSWVLFVPLLLFSFVRQCASGTWKAALGFGALGAAPMLALMLPTFLRYGVRTGGDLHGFLAPLNLLNVWNFFVILARLLSFASFELPRFLGLHTPDRMGFLLHAPWLLVPGLFLWVLGWVQALALLGFWFVRAHPQPGWKTLKLLVAMVFLVIYASFWFTVKYPLSNTYYLMSPLVMVYSLYCWDLLAPKPFWREFGKVFLAAVIFFQAGYAVQSAQNHVSAYSQTRERITKALAAGNYRLLGERRPGSLY